MVRVSVRVRARVRVRVGLTLTLILTRDDPLSDDDWAVVLVDDRIPCDASGLAAFCRNRDPSVYWAMIVEKAYAKLSGSYEAMQGGTVVQGLEDLTGGVGYKFDWEKGEKGEKEWVPPKVR